MTTTTAMIPPISVGDEDVGVFVGEASGGDEEDGKVIVVITDVMVVTGVGVMREDSFAQYRARNVTLADDTPSSSQLIVTSLMPVQ
jgi:hypothetical protein